MYRNLISQLSKPTQMETQRCGLTGEGTTARDRPALLFVCPFIFFCLKISQRDECAPLKRIENIKKKAAFITSVNVLHASRIGHLSIYLTFHKCALFQYILVSPSQNCIFNYLKRTIVFLHTSSRPHILPTSIRYLIRKYYVPESLFASNAKFTICTCLSNHVQITMLDYPSFKSKKFKPEFLRLKGVTYHPLRKTGRRKPSPHARKTASLNHSREQAHQTHL